jgi:Gpi18-like mannosyltransferase
MYSVYNALFPNQQNSQNVYLLFLKLPNIFAEILIGVMIYFAVLVKTKKKYALMSSALFLLNPVVIYNSAVWGQTDGLNNVFFFASLILLLTNRHLLSVCIFFLSLYVKLSLLPLFPLYMLILLKKIGFNIPKAIMYIGVSSIFILLLTLPISTTPHIWLTEFFMKNSAGELQYITNYTFNFWSVLFNPDSFSLVPLSSDVYFGLPLSVWAYILFGMAYIPLFVYIWRQKKLEHSQIYAVLAIAAFAVFLLLPRMHQRYIYPALPLLAVYIGMTRKNLIPYILLSIVNFINLYVVWHPGDFLPIFFTNIIAHSKIRLSMSILTVVIFIFMYIQIIKNHILIKSRNSR